MALSNTEIINRILERDLSVYSNLSMLMDMAIAVREEGIDGENIRPLEIRNIDTFTGVAKKVKQVAAAEARNDARFLDLYWAALHTLAPYDFDSYLLYMERERPARNRFYLPRRTQLLKIGAVQLLQDLEDDKLDVGSISVVPGAGKTSLAEFYMTWIIGRNPDCYNIFASHSGGIDRMFYDAVDAITGTPEYKFTEIFPDCKRYSTNAKDMQINFGKYKPFKSLSCVSVGQNLAGRVRANHLLLCDDLVSGIELAVSKPRLEKLWQSYTVDLLQRRIDGCKELHIATRWATSDPIGRLKVKYAGSNRAKFIAVPDIDPVTGESNFDYKYGVGFSKEYFQDIEQTMDKVSYRCLFKNEPIEREGLLYPEDSLRRYLTLPEGEPETVLAVVDTKNKGTDYMFMPVFLKYGLDYYMVDCVCDDNSDYDAQYEKLSSTIIRNGIKRVEFETNNGGDRVAKTVSDMIIGKSICSITTHYTTQNKETKILVNAEWVKKHCIFKDSSMYAPRDDYGTAMGFLTTYTTVGKNSHDDVPDGLAQFAEFTENLLGGKTEIMDSPF